MSYHSDKKSADSLTIDKIKTNLPSLEININDLNFKFWQVDLQHRKEVSPSHFVAKVFDTAGDKIASLNVYSTYKVTALMSKSQYLSLLHDCIPLFVESIK